MSLPRYTCDQLGVCQGDNPNCQLCAIERETRRQAQEEEHPDVWDSIGYWMAVSLLCIGSVAVIAGLAGYAWQRFTQ